MELSGDTLLKVIRTTGAPVKVLTEHGRLLGKVSPSQAEIMILTGDFQGGGSTNRVRFIQYTKKREMAPFLGTPESFSKAHDLPRFDPSYFRSFAGYPSPKKTSRAKKKRK